LENVSLKKDEQKKILVKYESNERVFYFRWTLYVNEGLVVHSSYDKQVSQHVLYLNHTNQSFRVTLKSKGAGSYAGTYVLVKFKEFDIKENKAIFELFLSDPDSQTQMEYLKNV